MELYGLNNIVKCGSYIYYIDFVGERMHLRNETSQFLCGVTIEEDEKDLIEDIELSDCLLDSLFPRRYYHDNEEEWYWEIDDCYTIEKDEDGFYVFMRGYRNHFLYLTNVRELQNAYHFFSYYEKGELLNENIDKKIKKFFKLI